jgi:lipopolysaccharide export LptBFGC system permease protein LptF
MRPAKRRQPIATEEGIRVPYQRLSRSYATLMQRHMMVRLLLGATVTTLIFSCVTLLTEASALFAMMTSGVVKVSSFLLALLLLMPEQFYAVVPLATAIAVAHGYHEWGRRHEIVSLQMAGLDNLSIAVPGFVIGLVGLLFTAANSLYLLPVTARMFEDIRYSADQIVMPSALDEGYLQRVESNLSISFRRRVDDQTVEGVIILDGRTAGVFTYIFADRGRFVVQRGQHPEHALVLEHGSYYRRKSTEAHASPAVFEELIIPIDIDNPGKRTWRGFFEQHIFSLLNPPPAVRAQPTEYGNWIAEGTNRLALPLLCLSYAVFTTALLLRPWQRVATGGLRVTLALAGTAVWHGFMLMFASLIVAWPWLAPILCVLALVPGAIGVSLIIAPARPARSRGGVSGRWYPSLNARQAADPG